MGALERWSARLSPLVFPPEETALVSVGSLGWLISDGGFWNVLFAAAFESDEARQERP